MMHAHRLNTKRWFLCFLRLVANRPGSPLAPAGWSMRRVERQGPPLMMQTCACAGGLLSTHVLLKRAPEAVPGYSGGLLALGAKLGDALMPAFATPSGVPLSWVNLQRVRLRVHPCRLLLPSVRSREPPFAACMAGSPRMRMTLHIGEASGA